MANKNPLPDDLPEHLKVPAQLERIFMPMAFEQREEFHARDSSARFVHYTSAEAALSIIRSKRIWMRNTTCMADYREV
jgi:hypothetical protein